jgi:hypothetical protein
VKYNDISEGSPQASRTSKGVTVLTLTNGFPMGRTICVPIGWNNILEVPTNPTDSTIIITTDDDGDLVARRFVITVYPQT